MSRPAPRPGSVGRRLRWVLGTWASACVALSLMAFDPSVPLLGAVAAVVAVVAVALAVPTAAGPSRWAVDDLPSPGAGRGADHATTQLAVRLATSGDEDDRAARLAAEVRDRVAAVLVERVARTRGVDLAVRPDLVAGLLPEQLSALVVGAGPSDRRLLDPVVLDAVLSRIESL